ncbi:hypothetical protein KC19_1G167600 [Ceratodon purpureus]|uniref:Ubiquitin-like protease family profile domain-containing protein n=1 Tax=Ceratodon purpureus TaxID=3225 RepID=A0A8T0J5X6_CERPU|nr:hypothetical protein KC19_1G167600 [Ceratodon purpureus]
MDGHDSEEIFGLLKRYLVEEWNYSIVSGEYEDVSIDTTQEVTTSNIHHKRVQVPLQENGFDCGIFLLYYIKKFVANARKMMKMSDLETKFTSLLRKTIQQELQFLFDADQTPVGKIQETVALAGVQIHTPAGIHGTHVLAQATPQTTAPTPMPHLVHGHLSYPSAGAIPLQGPTQLSNGMLLQQQQRQNTQALSQPGQNPMRANIQAGPLPASNSQPQAQGGYPPNVLFSFGGSWNLGSKALSRILDVPQYKIHVRIPHVGREIATRACITSDEFRAFEEQKQHDDAEKKRLVQVKKEAREALKRTKALATAQKKGKAVKVPKKTSKPILNQATLQDQKKTRKAFVSPLVKQE